MNSLISFILVTNAATVQKQINVFLVLNSKNTCNKVILLIVVRRKEFAMVGNYMKTAFQIQSASLACTAMKEVVVSSTRN